MQNEEFKLFCGMVDGLAFLPVPDVRQGFDTLEGMLPALAVAGKTPCSTKLVL